MYNHDLSNNDCYRPDLYGDNSLAAFKEREPLSFFLIILIPFIVAAISVAGLPGFHLYVKIFGGLCAAGFCIMAVQRRIVFPLEILSLFIFIMWSVVGGLTAQSTYLYYLKFFSMVQIFGLTLIMANMSDSTRAARVLLWAVLIGCVLVAVSGYASGEFQRAQEDDGDRVAGFSLNSNLFSIVMVCMLFLCMYFFKSIKHVVMKALFIAAMLLVSLLVIASGSRTGFISMILAYLSWFMISYGREISKRPLFFVSMLLLMIALIVFGVVMSGGTTLQERMEGAQVILKGGAGDQSSRTRLHLMLDGVKIITSNPIVGIGLDNFVVYKGWVSHSNSIEIFATTGIPGGLLYYTIFFILLRRLWRIRRNVYETEDLDFVNLALSFLFVHLITDIVNISYYSKIHWILIGILIGWSYWKENKLKNALLARSSPAENLSDTSDLLEAY
jgi:O-antigen ligase